MGEAFELRHAVELMVLLLLVLAVAWPLGAGAAHILGPARGAPPRAWRAPFAALAAVLERRLGAAATRPMGWRDYARALLLLNGVGLLATFALQLAQGVLPQNPRGLPGVRWDTALCTAVSFVTNTNWQSYSGEAALSNLVQAGALTVQNFLSAATGIAAMAALARGLASRGVESLGNAWSDLIAITVRLLLPLALVLALLLAAGGVPQTWRAPLDATPLDRSAAAVQSIALGPVASQVAIKQLGTNGGGFYNANSAHPLENPTPLTHLLEGVALLALPAGLVLAFGRLTGARRHGRALLATMVLLFVPAALALVAAESHLPPPLAAHGVSAADGAMEGKEVRFGAVESAWWAAATTAASNGSVNAMHDSFTPLGGLVALVLMQLGEVVFGGVGSGVYGMVLFVLVAVFVAALMVGRTPEYLGKKVEAHEMKLACVGLLVPSLCVLIGTAVATASSFGRASVANPGAHGFSELLYAFTSAANNNGSAFAGLSADQPAWNLLLALAMAIGRYAVLLPALALAGSFARKRPAPPSPATLPTHGALFVALLAAVVVLLGALTFVPALLLGPVVDHLAMTVEGAR